MSSHHIVRDQQEPALILVDLAAFPYDLLGQLLEWAPYTICGPEAFEQALKYEINLDVAYTNRPDARELLSHFPGISIFPSSANWLENALNYLESKSHRAVNVVVARDDFDLEAMRLANQKMLADFIAPSSKFIYVQGRFSKWMAKGSQLRIHSNQPVKVEGAVLKGSELLISEEGIVQLNGNWPFVVELGLI